MSGKSVVRRIALAIAAVVVVALVAGVVTTFTFLRRPLPAHGNEQELPGLSADVEVIRDELGIPQVYADTAADLFMAQGYVHAQDRFFEMDYRRHLTAGRLAELVGEVETAITADQVIRTMGWRRVAEQEWDLLEPRTRTYLSAYADGVNAYLAERAPSSLGIEYTVLGLNVDVDDVEPWDPIDSLAWLKAMAWDLVGNYSDELERAATYGQTGDLDMVEAIFPQYPTTQNLPILPTEREVEAHTEYTAEQNSDGDGASAEEGTEEADAAIEDEGGSVDAGGTGALAAVETTLAALTAVPHPLGTGEGIGSNSWVVSGDHTATGAPLLANDPHLSPSVPGIWYQAGLHCRTTGPECPFDVSGFTFAGMPGVIIGHNADLAWGLTNLTADSSDFFLERLYPDGTYLYDGARHPITERVETIEVNGADPIELTVRSTEHGPIISDVLASTRGAGGVPLPENSPPAGLSGFAVSLSWTALTPGRTMDAVFAIDQAADAGDIAEAAALFEVPTQNIVFATTDGDIGYQAPGRIPVRGPVDDGAVPADGSWPRPGWDPRYDWQGYLEPAELPAELNPAAGYIVAANQPVRTPSRYSEFGVDFDYGYRAQQIRDEIATLVEAGEPITAEHMSQIQQNEVNPAAEMLVPALLELDTSGLEGSEGFVAEAMRLFEDWDYVNDADSAAAAYFSSVWTNLLRLTFWDQVAEVQRPSGGSRWIEAVRLLLEDEDSPWWDDRATLNEVEQRDRILIQALDDARTQLTVSLGKDPEDWRWGRIHGLTPEHAVLGGAAIPGPIADYMNLSPTELGGGSSIVNANGWRTDAWIEGYPDFSVTAVPSMRMVVDLGDLDASTWVNLTGSSGHPASAHYDDQYQAWAAGETFAWPFSREAIDAAESRTLTLRP
ncbi:penicillin acylase family protein [Ruania halotolerans]|uniref:penicillin acylase family protein n=1 Tax=Ruania halotolerans TaxID=2897773 RepID=UPI001E577D12|nr:penicillin acylase family protein [Ruania halotolerans]UFU07305.1 penicillin acylase family protein [Ruania halotolerans]